MTDRVISMEAIGDLLREQYDARVASGQGSLLSTIARQHDELNRLAQAIAAIDPARG